MSEEKGKNPKELKPLTDEIKKQKIKKAAREGKIQFAPQDAIDLYSDITIRMLRRVLRLDAFVTDMSHLHDFPEEIEVYVERIKEEFQVDVAPVQDEEFSVLLPYIKSRL